MLSRDRRQPRPCPNPAHADRRKAPDPTDSPSERLQAYLDKLKLKMTPQRRVILETFVQQTGHVCAEELHSKLRRHDTSIGQSTVYRAMKLFVAAAVAKQIDLGDGVTRYEPAFGQARHDHIICRRCGKSVEIADEAIERMLVRIASEQGFTPEEHTISFYCLCAQCAADPLRP